MIEKLKNLSEDDCIVDFLNKEVQKHDCKKCGKCVFGYEGVTQLELILKDIITKKALPDDYELLHDIGRLMAYNSLCEKGTNLGKAVLYAIKNYEQDFKLHISKKECTAGVCQSFLTFHILASKCDGCDECRDICQDDAILGKKRFIHVINLDDCMQCGKCLSICPKKAIVTAGAKKPKGPKKPIPVKR